MNDNDFYTACAIAAMQALIAKVPLVDREHGGNADAVGLEICMSADRYAADMVRIRRGRLGVDGGGDSKDTPRKGSSAYIEHPVTLREYSGPDLEAAAISAGIPGVCLVSAPQPVGHWPEGRMYQCVRRKLRSDGRAELPEALTELWAAICHTCASSRVDPFKILLALHSMRLVEQRTTGARWWEARYATRIDSDNEYQQKPLTAEESARLEDDRKRLY